MIGAVLAAFCLGVVLVFAGAWAIDSYHGWRCHRKHLQELRKRPRVPYLPHRFEVWYEERMWNAHAFDHHGVSINAFSSSEHPMDAIGALIARLQEEEVA